MSKVVDLLKLQNAESMKNSFYRAPKLTPTIIQHEDKVEVRTADVKVYLEKIEETILGIIADFKFAPYWLIQQWYEDFEIYDSFERVSSWIAVGLTWIETSPLGIFIRPTKFLLDMFKIENQAYIDIPFGLLNHTCGEEQLVFDIQMGNPKSEMWYVIKDEETLPCYHPLNITPKHDEGTIIIREGNYKVNRYKPEELLQREEDLKREIKSGRRFTSEFNDFTLFPIVYVNEKEEVIVKTPDLLVPIPRNNMLPKSYAIEIELSAKTADKYNDIMRQYKDNIKFGKLFYLCGNNRIARLIKDAFKEVKGLGTCELYILPFTPPALRLTDYSLQDEENQKSLIKLSINVSK
jgi:hypothetical protein